MTDAFPNMAAMGAAAVAEIRERPTRASAPVDLVADMKRRHGVVDKPATATSLRVDIVAEMRRRHGLD